MTTLNILSKLRELNKFIYNIYYPEDEKYGLRSQIRRASVSVILNVREGNVFKDNRKLTHFQRALGSLEEVDECMLITMDIDHITKEYYNEFKTQHYWECLNMLKKLIASISSKE